MLCLHGNTLKVSFNQGFWSASLLQRGRIYPYHRPLHRAAPGMCSSSTGAAEPVVAATASAHSQQAWEMFRSWGSPQYFVAPMVDQVHLPEASPVDLACAPLLVHKQHKSVNVELRPKF